MSVYEKAGQYFLRGRLPWVTNLRADKFVAIFVASFENSSRAPLIIAVPSEAIGLTRSAYLEFVSLQGANTAALTFHDVALGWNGAG